MTGAFAIALVLGSVALGWFSSDLPWWMIIAFSLLLVVLIAVWRVTVALDSRRWGIDEKYDDDADPRRA